ncbi:MAG: hypothetical protein GEU81_03120 [Nitriliruptorales bacterium]|nr:hypothetical protein [Nitriliruptorales bacterium]
MAMAWRLAEQFLIWELGDPSFVDVSIDDLTDPDRNAALAERIPMDSLLAIDPGAPPEGLEGNTTHLTVVDADGMVVSMTNTLTNFWGSGQYARGFFVNDQLSRFAVGQGPANQPEAGKRSVSWTLPTLIIDGEGRPVLGLGTPGGRRIPTGLAQVLLRWAFQGEPLADAVEAPRFHIEGTELQFEQLPPAEVADDLRRRGYTSLTVPTFPYYFGSIQALEIDYEGDQLLGATDPRREADWRVDTP